MSNNDMVLKIANVNQNGLVRFEKENFGRINKTGNNAIKTTLKMLDRKDPDLNVKDQTMFAICNSKWAVRIMEGNGFATGVLNGVYYEFVSWIIHNKVFSAIFISSPEGKHKDCFVFVETNARTKVSNVKLHSACTDPRTALPPIGLGWPNVKESHMEKTAEQIVELLNKHL